MMSWIDLAKETHCLEDWPKEKDWVKWKESWFEINITG
jgi:hypothetical protein